AGGPAGGGPSTVRPGVRGRGAPGPPPGAATAAPPGQRVPAAPAPGVQRARNRAERPGTGPGTQEILRGVSPAEHRLNLGPSSSAPQPNTPDPGIAPCASTSSSPFRTTTLEPHRTASV